MSVLDMRSNGLESQNKVFRSFMTQKSFKKSILRQTTDCLKQQYLTVTHKYAVLIENAKRGVYKCSKCKQGFHNKRGCQGSDETEYENHNVDVEEEDVDEELDEVQIDNYQWYAIESDSDIPFSQSDDEQQDGVDVSDTPDIPSNLPEFESHSADHYNDYEIVVPFDYFKVFKEASDDNKALMGLKP